MKQQKDRLKKLLLAILGLAFALAFTSCDDQDGKVRDAKTLEKEKHHRRW